MFQGHMSVWGKLSEQKSESHSISGNLSGPAWILNIWHLSGKPRGQLLDLHTAEPPRTTERTHMTINGQKQERRAGILSAYKDWGTFAVKIRINDRIDHWWWDRCWITPEGLTLYAKGGKTKWHKGSETDRWKHDLSGNISNKASFKTEVSEPSEKWILEESQRIFKGQQQQER